MTGTSTHAGASERKAGIEAAMMEAGGVGLFIADFDDQESHSTGDI